MKNKNEAPVRKGHTNPGYFISEGFRSVFRHGLMSFAAAVIVLACLLIGGCFFMVIINANAIVTGLEQENKVIVYVDETYTEAEARSLGSRLNQIENVASCTFMTRKEALEQWISRQEDPELFAGTDASALRDRFYIVLGDITQMDSTLQSLREVEGVARVSAYMEMARGFAAVRNVLRVVTYGISAVLLVISVFIISNTVKLATFNRREEIAVMKTVGATNGFIRWPFVIQGLILGIISAVSAFALQWVVYDLAEKAIARSGLLEITTALPFMSFAYVLALGDLAVGVAVGVFGSVLAIGKYLKK
ncbi:MAG: permease-like cell division protein FtsX [Oscillospiraceae bacterium]|nr:permease-like cell division protein FtsX [Oscillospiraceae bacterium]